MLPHRSHSPCISALAVVGTLLSTACIAETTDDSDETSYIANGVDDNSRQYVAAIEYTDPQGRRRHCSGVAVAPRIVITNNQCVPAATGRARIFFRNDEFIVSQTRSTHVAVFGRVEQTSDPVKLVALRLDRNAPRWIGLSNNQFYDGYPAVLTAFGRKAHADNNYAMSRRSGRVFLTGRRGDRLDLTGPAYALDGDQGGTLTDEGPSGGLMGIISASSQVIFVFDTTRRSFIAKAISELS